MKTEALRVWFRQGRNQTRHGSEAFKVGTHTRLQRSEVLRFHDDRERTRKQACDSLRALDDELVATGAASAEQSERQQGLSFASAGAWEGVRVGWETRQTPNRRGVLHRPAPMPPL